MADERTGGAGRRLLRVLAIVLLALLVLWLLFTQVFPRVERYLEDPTLGTTVDVGAPLSVAGRG